MEHPSSGRSSKPKKVVDRIYGLNGNFTKKVPYYNEKIWSPEQAVKCKEGGSMAETLFVAGSLLANGEVAEEDLCVRFSSSHGKKIRSGLAGKTMYFSDVVLILNIEGQNYECGFRMTPVDNKPLIALLQVDGSITRDNDVSEYYTLSEGVYNYANRLGVPDDQIPTVFDLECEHLPGIGTAG